MISALPALIGLDQDITSASASTQSQHETNSETAWTLSDQARFDVVRIWLSSTHNSIVSRTNLSGRRMTGPGAYGKVNHREIFKHKSLMNRSS